MTLLPSSHLQSQVLLWVGTSFIHSQQLQRQGNTSGKARRSHQCAIRIIFILLIKYFVLKVSFKWCRSALLSSSMLKILSEETLSKRQILSRLHQKTSSRRPPRWIPFPAQTPSAKAPHYPPRYSCYLKGDFRQRQSVKFNILKLLLTEQLKPLLFLQQTSHFISSDPFSSSNTKPKGSGRNKVCTFQPFSKPAEPDIQ